MLAFLPLSIPVVVVVAAAAAAVVVRLGDARSTTDSTQAKRSEHLAWRRWHRTLKNMSGSAAPRSNSANNDHEATAADPTTTNAAAAAAAAGLAEEELKSVAASFFHAQQHQQQQQQQAFGTPQQRTERIAPSAFNGTTPEEQYAFEAFINSSASKSAAAASISAVEDQDDWASLMRDIEVRRVSLHSWLGSDGCSRQEVLAWAANSLPRRLNWTQQATRHLPQPPRTTIINQPGRLRRPTQQKARRRPRRQPQGRRATRFLPPRLHGTTAARLPGLTTTPPTTQTSPPLPLKRAAVMRTGSSSSILGQEAREVVAQAQAQAQARRFHPSRSCRASRRRSSLARRQSPRPD